MQTIGSEPTPFYHTNRSQFSDTQKEEWIRQLVDECELNCTDNTYHVHKIASGNTVILLEYIPGNYYAISELKPLFSQTHFLGEDLKLVR